MGGDRPRRREQARSARRLHVRRAQPGRPARDRPYEYDGASARASVSSWLTEPRGRSHCARPRYPSAERGRLGPASCEDLAASTALAGSRGDGQPSTRTASSPLRDLRTRPGQGAREASSSPTATHGVLADTSPRSNSDAHDPPVPQPPHRSIHTERREAAWQAAETWMPSEGRLIQTTSRRQAPVAAPPV